MRAHVTILVLSGLAIALAACGGGPAVAAPRETRVEVQMKEFAFKADTITVKRGEKVTISLKNAGTIEHEFMAGRFGAGSKGYAQDLFAGVSYEVAPMASIHGMRHGTMAGGAFVAPGRTATLSFVVPDRPGTYEFGCFVAGHYESGMKGTLTIE